jgi:hypothetical protein
LTQDEIIEMTRQAANAIPGYTAKVEDPSGAVLEFYNRFAKLVAQHEREACAEVCKKHADFYAGLEPSPIAQSAWAACIDNRDAILARGHS